MSKYVYLRVLIHIATLLYKNVVSIYVHTCTVYNDVSFLLTHQCWVLISKSLPFWQKNMLVAHHCFANLWLLVILNIFHIFIGQFFSYELLTYIVCHFSFEKALIFLRILTFYHMANISLPYYCLSLSFVCYFFFQSWFFKFLHRQMYHSFTL